MRNPYSGIRRCRVLPVLISLLFSFVAPRSLWAQTFRLENPPPGSSQSGVGLVSGWACQAGRIDVIFNNVETYQASYGTIREDTRPNCGDDNNGFGFLWNWSRLGDGVHTVRVLADGNEIGSATVTVTTLGAEFLTGASGAGHIANFPQPGDTLSLIWQEGVQNFLITAASKAGGQGICSTKAGTVTNFLTGNQLIFTVANLCAGDMLAIQLATPGGNSGAFSVCDTQLSLVQGGTQFSKGMVKWADAAGGVVCENLLPGVTKETTVMKGQGVALNLNSSFDVFYDQVRVAEFR